MTKDLILTDVAIIDGNVVTNIIAADLDVTPLDVLAQYHTAAVDLTGRDPQPRLKWSYDVKSDTFSPPPVNLAVVQAQNIATAQTLIQQFVVARYSLETRFSFNALYNLALDAGLTNRLAYIKRLFTWAQAVIAYAATYAASVMAQTDPAVVQAMSPDFTALAAADPYVTPVAAIQIPN